jgi:hypothetical protein
MRLRFELNTEFFTVTAFADFSEAPDMSIVALENQGTGDRVLQDVQWHFGILADILNRKLRDKSQPPFSNDHWRNELCKFDAHDYLYHEFWSNFEREFLLTQSMQRSGIQRSSRYGRVFADFHGLVVNEPTKEKKAEEVFERPFEPNTEPSQVEPYRDIPTWSSEKIKQFWPFLTCSQRIDLKNFEFTASSLLRGRAVYVSALGAQPPEPAGSHEPVLYFVACRTRRKWQIARLLDTLHQLGTVRLAAIVELDRLHKSGGWLRDIERLIEATRKSIEKNSQAIGARDEKKREEATARVIRIVAANVSSMEGKLATIFRIGDESYLGKQSLAYRLERAAYYIQQFTTGVRRLEPERIEGYQPYDQFVLRRLGSAFAYVQMLNQRHQRITQEIRFFVQYLAAQSAVIQAIRTNRTNQTIERAQVIGEIVLFGALLPYYVGHVLGDTIIDFPVTHAILRWLVHDGNIVAFIATTAKSIVSLLCFFAGLWLAYRSLKKHRSVVPEIAKPILARVRRAKKQYGIFKRTMNTRSLPLS